MPDPAAHVATACGKIILLGEHAVVHGETAIASSIGRSAEAFAQFADHTRLRLSDDSGTWVAEQGSELDQAFHALLQVLHATRPVALDARIHIPTRAGLGSSAALGVAAARSVASLLGLHPDAVRDVDAATAWERVFHGNPSGIDVAVAARGGSIAYCRRLGARPVPMTAPLMLCLVQAGPRASTRSMVEAASRFLAAHAAQGAEILAAIREAVAAGTAALQTGDTNALGKAMNDNQRALRQWGLSTSVIDMLCADALRTGALGAKLTGAGGGGSVICLAPGRENHVLDAWRSRGFVGRTIRVGAG